MQRTMSSAFRSPKRISITVPFALYQQLVTESMSQGRSISNLSAYILENSMSMDMALAAAVEPPAGQRLVRWAS